MIIFETPTELDLAAITTFGLSAKECDTPIGRFGTGLKYALAILMREEAEVVIYSGLRQMRIRSEPRDFRGQEFFAIVVEPENEPRFDLPFTTQLGRDWELWQAFRELHSNTIDEAGRTYRHTHAFAKAGVTAIVVAHADFEAIYDERGQIIIEDKPLWENESLAIYEGESQFMFYRGIRARDLEHPAAFRYSIKEEIDITEDRTIKYEWEADGVLVKALAACDRQDILEKALDRGKGTTEEKLDYIATEPGDAFARAVTSLKGKGEGHRAPMKAELAIAKPVEDAAPTPSSEGLKEAERAMLLRVLETVDRMGFEAKFKPLIAAGVLPGGAKCASRRGKIYLADGAFENDVTLARCVMEACLEIRSSYVGSWTLDRLVDAYKAIATKEE